MSGNDLAWPLLLICFSKRVKMEPIFDRQSMEKEYSSQEGEGAAIALVERLKMGDSLAFEEIYNQNHKRLYFMAVRYLKDPELAADILQDVFVSLWTKRETLDSSQDVGGFLFTVLKNKVLNAIRSNKSLILKHIEISSQKQEARNHLEDELYKNMYKREFDAAIAKLPQKRRVIFKLKVFKGFDNLAVATRLNISVNTVKVQYQRATKQIRDSLKRL